MQPTRLKRVGSALAAPAVIVSLLVWSGCASMTREVASPTGGEQKVTATTAPGVEFVEAPELSSKELAGARYLVALAAREEGEPERATRELVTAVSLDPGEPKLRAQLVELYVREGELRRALEHALALRALEPDDIMHRLLAARLLVALQLYDDAIEEYRQVLTVAANHEETLVLLGSLYNRTGRREESVDILTRATAFNPDSFIANFTLGQALASAGRYDDALRSFRHAAKLYPTSYELHLNMGYVYGRLGFRRKAVESYRKAFEFNPGKTAAAGMDPAELDPDAANVDEILARYDTLVDTEGDPLATQVKVGLLHFTRGHYFRAANELGVVLGARPGDDEVRYWLALTYDKLGDFDAAVKQLEGISPASPTYIDARVLLAGLLHGRGDADEAVESIKEMLKAHPDNPEGLRRLIALYQEKKEYEKAIEVASKLVAEEPQNDDYLYYYALLHDLAGQKDRAVLLLRDVIRLNPRNERALNHLGYTFAEKGINLDEAEVLVRRALEIHPNDGAFLDTLGWVYYQRGDYEAAVAELEKAVRLAGKDPVIVEHLADAYARVGRNEDAIRLYRDCEARTEDLEQRERVRRNLAELQQQRARTPETDLVGGNF